MEEDNAESVNQDIKEKDYKEPIVIRPKYAFTSLKVLNGKNGDPDEWCATCRHCKTTLTEKYHTTSAFTK